MTIDYIKREEVGLIPPRAWRKPFDKPDRNIAHYFGVDIRMAKLEDLFRIHRNTQYNDMFVKTYSDIMYNFGGNVFDPRPMELGGLNSIGAANGGGVTNALGPSFLFPWGPDMTFVQSIPNWEDNVISSAQAFDALVAEKFGNDLPWDDHQGVGRATACAGNYVRSLLDTFDGRPPAPQVPRWLPDPNFKARPKVGLEMYGGLAWDGYVDYGYVRWVQMFLNTTAEIGRGCSVTGVWDSSHDRCLTNFQGYFHAQGFPCPVTHVTDEGTWATIHLFATQLGIV